MFHFDVTIEDLRIIAHDAETSDDLTVWFYDSLKGKQELKIMTQSDFATMIDVAIRGDDTGELYNQARRIVDTLNLCSECQPIP